MRGSLSTSKRRLMYGKHSCARQAPVMRLDGITASVTQLGRRCNGRFQQPPHLHDGIFRIHLHHNTTIVAGEVTQHATAGHAANFMYEMFRTLTRSAMPSMTLKARSMSAK